jgi:hypothetical protein
MNHLLQDNNNEMEYKHFELTGTEEIKSYGGEFEGEGIALSHYGLDFGEFTVGDITPKQMENLACEIVNHLLLAGHKFEFKKNSDQDLPYKITCK